MSTHTIRTARRFPAAAVGILLALAVATSTLAIQAESLWVTRSKPVPAAVVGETDGIDYSASSQHFGPRRLEALRSIREQQREDRPTLQEVLNRK